MEGGTYSGYGAPYEEQDNYDQDNYHMPSDVGAWYAAQGVQMDPTRASSLLQGHFSSQEYHSSLDSIGEYATNAFINTEPGFFSDGREVAAHEKVFRIHSP